MYINVSWEPTPGTASSDARQLILDELDTRGFANAFEPTVGCVLANTPRDKKSEVDDLQGALRKLPITFVVTATQRGWLMWRSADVSLATCKKIADHAH